MRRLLALISLFAVGGLSAGCNATAPSQAQSLSSQKISLPQGLEATGMARVSNPGSANASLDVDVRFHNTSSGTVSFMVLARVPVALRIYDGVSARSVLLYDQANAGGNRLGRRVTIAPNDEEVLSNGVSLAELRANLVGSGPVLIVALVTASSDIGGQFEVPIGEMILP